MTPGAALITAVQQRPCRRPCSGWARIAAPMPPQGGLAHGRFAGRGRRGAAAARASARSGSGWLGRLQPSMPGSGRPIEPGELGDGRGAVALHGMAGALVAPGRRAHVARAASMPVCLPEQLLWSRRGAWPLRTSAAAAGANSGGCGPQARAASSRPRRASQASTSATCIGLAAVRGAGQRQLGVAHPERVGSTAFHQRQRLERLDRRARVTRARRRRRPTSTTARSASATQQRTRWRLSTRSPRQTSTATGVAAISLSPAVARG